MGSRRHGKVNAEVVFDPAPIVALQTLLEGIADADVKGELTAGIPAFRIGCAIAAMAESAKIGRKASANVTAQRKLATALTRGFK